MERPPRRRRPERPPRRNSSDSADRQERQFVESIETRINTFLASNDPELDLEPMNSYKRRLVHKLAVQYKLDTESRGEEPERRVCLVRTGDSAAPTGRPGPRSLDFGAQTFPINPGEEGLHLALKMDGTIELWQERDSHQVLDHRLVTTRQIRIRNGKIVTPEDAEW